MLPGAAWATAKHLAPLAAGAAGVAHAWEPGPAGRPRNRWFQRPRPGGPVQCQNQPLQMPIDPYAASSFQRKRSTPVQRAPAHKPKKPTGRRKLFFLGNRIQIPADTKGDGAPIENWRRSGDLVESDFFRGKEIVDLSFSNTFGAAIVKEPIDGAERSELDNPEDDWGGDDDDGPSAEKKDATKKAERLKGYVTRVYVWGSLVEVLNRKKTGGGRTSTLVGDDASGGEQLTKKRTSHRKSLKSAADLGTTESASPLEGTGTKNQGVPQFNYFRVHTGEFGTQCIARAPACVSDDILPASFAVDFESILRKEGGSEQDGRAADILDQLPKFVKVRCSENSVWALTDSGYVYVWEDVMSQYIRAMAYSKKGSGTGSDNPEASKVPEDGQGSANRAGRLTRFRARVLDLENVVDMDVSMRHLGFVVQDDYFRPPRGRAYLFGANGSGQCGKDPEIYRQDYVAQLNELKLEDVDSWKAIRVGGWHTFVVENRSIAYSCGDDRKTQLGHGDTRGVGSSGGQGAGSSAYGTHISTFNMPAGASMGSVQTAQVGGGGATVNRRKSYGRYEQHAVHTPLDLQPPPLFQKFPKVEDVACGDDFTIVKVSADEGGRARVGGRQKLTGGLKLSEFRSGDGSGGGKVFGMVDADSYILGGLGNFLLSFGNNSVGQCGRSMQILEQPTASFVKLPPQSEISKVTCGSQHCAALVRRDAGSTGSAATPESAVGEDLYVWGSNYCGQIAKSEQAKVCPPARVTKRVLGRAAQSETSEPLLRRNTSRAKNPDPKDKYHALPDHERGKPPASPDEPSPETWRVKDVWCGREATAILVEEYV